MLTLQLERLKEDKVTLLFGERRALYIGDQLVLKDNQLDICTLLELFGIKVDAIHHIGALPQFLSMKESK